MNRFAFAAATLMLASACETAPPAPDPVGTPMGEAQFASALRGAKADANPYSGEKKLTRLIDNTTLAVDQKARALYARGQLRRNKVKDKAGAVADFQEYGRVAPQGTFAINARTEAGYAQSEMRAAEQRLRGLQNHASWFDDTWALGKRDEAATRYKRSKLTPEPFQVYALQSTGYLCKRSGGQKLVNYGASTPETNGLYWCK